MTEIRECGRTIGGGVVAFHIEWDGGLTGETVASVVTIDNEDDSERVVLCHERSAGSAVQFVASDGRRQEVREDVTLEDDQVTVRFPLDVVGVAADWPTWKALLVVDGETVAEQALPTP